MHESTKRRNLAAAANAVELCTRTLAKVAGRNGTAATISGQKQTRQVIADAVAAKMASTISDNIPGAEA